MSYVTIYVVTFGENMQQDIIYDIAMIRSGINIVQTTVVTIAVGVVVVTVVTACTCFVRLVLSVMM